MADHSPNPYIAINLRLNEAHNACCDALDFLHIIDLALVDMMSTHRFVGATLTVLQHVQEIIEQTRDQINFTKEANTHG